MFELSAKKGLCYVICGSEVKTSDCRIGLFTQFWRCKYGFVEVFICSTNIQGWQNQVNRIYKATCIETSQVNRSYVN